ncbi:MAG: hypothetical protein WAL01_24535 [Pseudolabrys sp.]
MSPPSAGPQITAVWFAEVQAAIAREIKDGGTRVGASACAVGISNARAQPMMNTAMNNRFRPSVSVSSAVVIMTAASA